MAAALARNAYRVAARRHVRFERQGELTMHRLWPVRTYTYALVLALAVPLFVAGVLLELDQDRAAFALLVASAVAALVAAIVLARRIAQPIVRISAVASRVAAGDRSVRAEPEGPLEVAEIAGQMNRMLDELAVSEAPLRQRRAGRDADHGGNGRAASRRPRGRGRVQLQPFACRRRRPAGRHPARHHRAAYGDGAAARERSAFSRDGGFGARAHLARRRRPALHVRQPRMAHVHRPHARPGAGRRLARQPPSGRPRWLPGRECGGTDGAASIRDRVAPAPP